MERINCTKFSDLILFDNIVIGQPLNMLRKLIFLFVTLLVLPLFTFSQNEVEGGLDEFGRDLDGMTLLKSGPNKDKYTHLFLAYGFLLGEPESDSADIIYGKSSAFQIGLLFKWRVAKIMELGFDISYHYAAFHLEQDSSKLIPNRQLHDKEKMLFNDLMLTPFVRIKLKNKYHSTGTFIDLGGFAGFTYRAVHYTVDYKLVPNSHRTKIRDIRLDYNQSYSYGAMVRLGFNRIIIYGKYRFSDLFKKEFNYPELPRVEAGLMIGLHN